MGCGFFFLAFFFLFCCCCCLFFLNLHCWVFEQPHVPLPGSCFIYLLETERLGGRALYFSMLCFMMRLHSEAFVPFGQVSFCTSVVPGYISSSFHLSSLFLLASCLLPAGLLFSFFPFLRLSFQVFVINLYFVKGFCCTRFCILTESDWLLFSSPKSGFCSQHLSPSCPVTVLVLAPSISNVQTVLANQHQVYLMFR